MASITAGNKGLNWVAKAGFFEVAYTRSSAYRYIKPLLTSYSFANIAMFRLASLLLPLFCVAIANGQEAEKPQRPELRFTRAVHGRARLGQSLALHAVVVNPTAEELHASIVVQISGQLGEEFARQVHVPPHSERPYDFHVGISKNNTSKQLEITATMTKIDQGREIILEDNEKPISHSVTLKPNLDPSVTALAMNAAPKEDVYWRWPREDVYTSYELAVATRVDSGFSREFTIFDGPLPLNLADWDTLDTLIVAEPKIFDDASGIAALQNFMQAGGRVWVMLDEIDTSMIRGLLGESQMCETVDVVELNRFEIQATDKVRGSMNEGIIELPKPVRFTRIVQSGGEVTHEIDGWPAAMRMQVGYGELRLTMLGSQGWIQPRTLQARPDPLFQSSFTVHGWAARFASAIHVPRADSPLRTTPTKYPMTLVGNPVVPRRTVMWSLMGFCVVLTGLAVWRRSVGDLNWMGVLAPAAAVIASLPLMLMAFQSRHDIPDTVARLQFVQTGSQSCLAQEQAVVFGAGSHSGTLSSNVDGVVHQPQVESGIRRVSTSDFQTWQLTNDAWPSGAWRCASTYSLPGLFSTAEAKLTSDGLVIQIPNNLPSRLEDPVVSFVPGATVLGSHNGDALTIDGRMAAENDRWMTTSLIDNEQLRRAEVYGQFFESNGIANSPQRTLYGWTQLWPSSPQWSERFEVRGSALVSIPVSLATPKTGSEVRVPYALVALQRSGDKTSLFDDRTGKWTDESTLAMQAEFQCVLPPEVVPFAAESIDIQWHVRAPSRKARLLSLANGEEIELASLDEPSIPWTTTITDPRILDDFRDGVLKLRVEVSGRKEQGANQSTFAGWSIKYLRVGTTGKTLPRNKLITQ